MLVLFPLINDVGYQLYILFIDGQSLYAVIFSLVCVSRQ